MVKSPPANAGDMGSISGPGRSHTPRNNYAHEPQLLSLCSRARELQLLSRCAAATKSESPRACALQLEKLPQRETLHQRERKLENQQRPSTAKK